jgi:hypothetical protein
MKLKVTLGQGQATWTLKPDRKYVFGSGSDCDVTLPQAQFGDVADHHLAFSFDTSENTWYVEDLGSSGGTYIENLPVSRSPILKQTRIAIANKVLLFAAPLTVASTSQNTTTIQSPPIQPPPVYGFPPQTPPPASRETFGSPVGRPYSSPLKVLSWAEYVEKQVNKVSNWFDQVAIRFFMVTGLRNTPWISLNEGSGLDGYIIPNFKESAERVSVEIEANLDRLRQYEDTDCNVVLLTDAHIAWETPDAMLALPLKRGGRKDFRRFCIVSHHRIRTYVVVDNYGTDLFVGRITRFEAQLSGLVPIIWMIIFLVASVFLTVFSGSWLRLYVNQESVFLWSIIIFATIWCGIFLGAPKLMQKLNSLPVPSNLYTVVGIMLFGLWAFVGLLTILFPIRF